MLPSGRGLGSKDISPVPPHSEARGSYVRTSAKRPREDSDPQSDSESKDNTEADTMEQMDFQTTTTQHITGTQALGDANDNPGYLGAELPPPLTAEHAALRADFEIIRASAMEQLYQRITANFNASVSASVAAASLNINNKLQNQVSLLNSRMNQMQRQLIANQRNIQPPPPTIMVAAPVKKILKKKLEKKNTAEGTGGIPTADSATSDTSSTTPQTPPANTRRWETVPLRTKTPVPKLITTKYRQAEQEVTCFFENNNTTGTTTQPEKTYTERQSLADIALRRVNTTFVDYKDIFVLPFIRTRVTIGGVIIFTTGNDQNNMVYEDYISIIKHALSYFGKCEKIEIGKLFSQFLLHGVPMHLSIPEISDSITTNYQQLVQGQMPRWLTPADRREYKTNSTIVMTLTGNVKNSAIGRQNLIACTRQCQLDNYIACGRSTQFHNCQTYGHPASLCWNDICCAICAGPHNTREYPCTLPTCKKGLACTHSPICCVNCNTPHKANDPNCPERIKLRNFNKATGVAIQGDAPHGGSSRLNSPPCIRWIHTAAKLCARPNNDNYSPSIIRKKYVRLDAQATS